MNIEMNKEDTRGRLINSAIKLFSRQGYHGTGLTQLLTHSESPKGSFYYHFPEGKAQLADEAIRRAGSDVHLWVDTCFNESTSFESGVMAVADSIASWFEKSQYAEGCPITSVLLATVPESVRLKTSSESVLQSWVDVVAKHACRYGLESQSEELGNAMVMSLEGAWILSRAVQSTKPFKVAASMVIALIRR